MKDEFVTAAQIAHSYGVSAAKLTERLAAHNVKKPGKYWKWSGVHHPDVIVARKIAGELAMGKQKPVKPEPKALEEKVVPMPAPKLTPKVNAAVISEVACAKASIGAELLGRGMDYLHEAAQSLKLTQGQRDLIKKLKEQGPTDLHYSSNRQVYRKVLDAVVTYKLLTSADDGVENIAFKADSLAQEIVRLYVIRRESHEREDIAI